MSLFTLSSYYLWTVKGHTYLPLVRGSCFLVKYSIPAFHSLHVLTAAHVSCPVRVKEAFGRPRPLESVGERHISCKLLAPNAEGYIGLEMKLRFKQRFCLNTDVASLNIENEDGHAKELEHFKAWECDLDPLDRGEEIIFCGMDLEEVDRNIYDPHLRMREKRVTANVNAAFASNIYGHVVLCTSDGRIIPSMSGGPVVRASNGKVVGVVIAPVVYEAQPPVEHQKVPDFANDKPEQKVRLFNDPVIDISCHSQLRLTKKLCGGFVPIREIFSQIRQFEGI